MRRSLLVFVVVLAGGTLVPVAMGGVSATGQGPAVTAADEAVEAGVVQTVTYSQDPENESTVKLRVEYRIDTEITGLVLFPPSRSTLVSATAFERQDNGRLFASEEFDSASATFQVELPRETVDDHWGQGVATAEWAVVGGLPGTAYFDNETSQWVHEDDDRVTRELTVEGEGRAGSRSVVLGEHTVHERTVNDTQIQLVTLPGPPPGQQPAEILDALAFTARTLDVGARDESVLVVHIPVRSSAVTGSTFSRRGGRQDVWLYAPGWGLENTWVHEYVHTRQDYELAEDMQWFDEASANYYEKLFALRAGVGEYDGFRERIQSATAGGTLSDPDRWQRGTQYVRGQRVLAALDARIQRETGYERSLADVFRRLNEHDGTVTLANFTAIASEVAGTDMDEWVQSHVAGTDEISFTDDPYAYTHPSGAEDPDGDGLTDTTERDRGTHPFRADTDGDGLNDSREVELGTDPTVSDTDEDGLADGREVDLGTDPTANDTDGDDLADGREVDLDTDPTESDTDGDGLSDGAEVDEYETDPTESDTDGDGLADGREVEEYGSDPTETDTDGDGLSDGTEVDEYGTDPAASDTDDDGLNDSRELDLDTDPTTADTDGDGLADGRERDLDTDPTTADTDDDGLSDGAEVDEYGTDPTERDTDGDGFTDRGEVDVGTDPTEPTSAVDFWVARVGGLQVVVAVLGVGAIFVLGAVGLVVWRLWR